MKMEKTKDVNARIADHLEKNLVHKKGRQSFWEAR